MVQRFCISAATGNVCLSKAALSTNQRLCFLLCRRMKLVLIIRPLNHWSSQIPLLCEESVHLYVLPPVGTGEVRLLRPVFRGETHLDRVVMLAWTAGKLTEGRSSADLFPELTTEKSLCHLIYTLAAEDNRALSDRNEFHDAMLQAAEQPTFTCMACWC